MLFYGSVLKENKLESINYKRSSFDNGCLISKFVFILFNLIKFYRYLTKLILVFKIKNKDTNFEN